MLEPKTDVWNTGSPTAGRLAVLLTDNRIIVGTLGAVVFAFLTAVGGHIRIPLTPVPITLQTLFVLLSGAIIGPRYGTLGQTLYLGLGTLGIPLFAGAAGGLAVISGPTGGYLLGFLVTPAIVGCLFTRRSGALWRVSVLALGSLIILTLGVIHLSLFYTHHLGHALAVGMLPFLIGDGLKVLAASSILGSYRRLRRSR